MTTDPRVSRLFVDPSIQLKASARPPMKSVVLNIGAHADLDSFLMIVSTKKKERLLLPWDQEWEWKPPALPEH